MLQNTDGEGFIPSCCSVMAFKVVFTKVVFSFDFSG